MNKRVGLLIGSLGGGLLIIAVVVGVLVSQSDGDTDFVGTVLNPPVPAADFTLTDQTGQSFGLQQAQGKVIALTFLYTSCTDVCPFIGVKMGQALRLLGTEASQVEIIVISVDPKRDTVERLAEYSRRLGMYDKWNFLTGSEEELTKVWDAYFVGQPIITDQAGFASDDELKFNGLFRGLGGDEIATANQARADFGGGYDVSHATPVWLIDRGQDIRVKLSQDLAPSELANDLRILIRSGN